MVSTAYRAWAVWWYDIPLPIVVLASSHLHQENVDFRHYQVRRWSTPHATAGLHLDTRLSSRPSPKNAVSMQMCTPFVECRRAPRRTHLQGALAGTTVLPCLPAVPVPLPAAVSRRQLGDWLPHRPAASRFPLLAAACSQAAVGGTAPRGCSAAALRERKPQQQQHQKPEGGP